VGVSSTLNENASENSMMRMRIEGVVSETPDENRKFPPKNTPNERKKRSKMTEIRCKHHSQMMRIEGGMVSKEFCSQ